MSNETKWDVFARAWVLGAWRVEETGEIVKLINNCNHIIKGGTTHEFY